MNLISLKKVCSINLSIIVFVLLIDASNSVFAQSQAKNNSIYHRTWIDLNKNGKKDPYEDPALPIKRRIDDLIGRMNLNEKTAQMATLYGYGRVLKDSLPTPQWQNEVWKDGIANIDEQLSNMPSHPATKTTMAWPPSKHVKAINSIQRFFIEKTRLGIPVDFTNEGIRGLAHEKATSFPMEIGIGSTWDVDLVNKIGHVEGKEAKALGYTNVYAPELDVGRDPRWGRIVSTYGEDPYLVSSLGVAMVKGMQAENVASTLKHFAVYSIPSGGRDGDSRDDPHATMREVHTLYLPPFKAAVEAGALGVMSSYNDYNGMPVTGSHYFLTDLLGRKWGFKGYIVTDSEALEYIYNKYHVVPNYEDAIKQAVEAGVNVRTFTNPPSVYLKPLRDAVKKHKIPIQTINKRVRDVLRVKFLLGLFDNPYTNVEQANGKVRTPTSEALSLRAAHESLVLLKNDDKVLPLNKDKIHSILVTGANAIDISRVSVSKYGPSYVKNSSILQSIRNKVNNGTKVTFVKGPNITDANWPESDVFDFSLSKSEKDQIAKAVSAAQQSDVAIIVVGSNDHTVGEGHSRLSLNLPGHQLALVRAIQKTGTPVIAVLINGRPLSINWMAKYVPAILEAWFPGEKGGPAIADALFGDYNPGGKLPVTFPKSAGQVPLAFPYWPVSHGRSEATEDSAHARVTGPLFPFGYGLSYTKFTYSDLKINSSIQDGKGTVNISLNIKNTGDREGDEVVQLYVHQKVAPVVRPVKKLRGFKRVNLAQNQIKRIHFEIKREDLKIFDKDSQWRVFPGTFEVMVGSSSQNIRLKGSFKIHQ